MKIKAPSFLQLNIYSGAGGLIISISWWMVIALPWCGYLGWCFAEGKIEEERRKHAD